MNKYIVLILLFTSTVALSQDCDLTVQGIILDQKTRSPISFATAVLEESNRGTNTDDHGIFELNKVCPGKCHLVISHLGYTTQVVHLNLSSDTLFTISLAKDEIQLDQIEVVGQFDEDIIFNKSILDRSIIENQSYKNLATLTSSLPGVQLLSNGAGISKPVIHGLYGNRVSILNNGIQQRGQQWGNDHAPEIDPFAADQVTVIKGASALEYQGGNLGSIIKVTPKPIQIEQGIHGQVAYTYETNGQGNTLNGRLEQHTPIISYRISGSAKQYGDRSTPDYFLTNTGMNELNLALQLEKSWKDKLFIEGYASTFNATIGILRGSHIGNLTDLNQAFSRETPLFTDSTLSYSINAPKQDISHHLFKFKTKYFITDNQYLSATLSSQINDREEFDIRRGMRSSRPALSLMQVTHDLNMTYHRLSNNGWDIKAGSQTSIIDNSNNPETGILPLIPDYLSLENGLFTVISKSIHSVNLNAGLRYDYVYQQAITISDDFPRRIIRYNHHYHNLSGILSVSKAITSNQNISVSSGLGRRNPGINELYSNGLHQGVSGIEEGDQHLTSETGWKNTIRYSYTGGQDNSLDIQAYSQLFKNYIYLEPQDEVRLTIRGAFPVFIYQQSDAHIYGFDVSSKFQLIDGLDVSANYSFIRGQNLSEDNPLVFIPPNQLNADLTYTISIPRSTSLHNSINDIDLGVDFNYTWRQNQLLTTQDFLPPPPAYQLFGFNIASDIKIGSTSLKAQINGSNLLNSRYRNYLNRQRYFADELGRSIIFNLQFKF